MENRNTKTYPVSELSDHLFWDTPAENINGHAHRAFIVERVMGYGRIKDWHTIIRWYGKEELKSIVTSLRELDDFSIAFLSLVLDIEKEDFRCYREQQFRPSFWNS